MKATWAMLVTNFLWVSSLEVDPSEDKREAHNPYHLSYSDMEKDKEMPSQVN